MTVRRFTGSAVEFHGRSIVGLAGVELWSFTVERPAIVLGPRQTSEVLDVDACRAAGVEIATRQSGGGLVLLEPGAVEWVDIVVPPTSPWWTDDVLEALVRCGQVWHDAVSAGGAGGRLGVYEGRLRRDALSDLICFAGLGAGEITDAAGGKLVGLSQRRTRDGARVQGVIHRRWNPDLLHSLLAPGGPSLADVRSIRVATLDSTVGPMASADLADALHSALSAAVTAPQPRPFAP